jgi:1,4-dihydroxy-2-naphthoate octaprenyltransferase
MKHWLTAFRLRTLPLSLSSIILGGFLAASNGCFQWVIFSLAVVTTIFLQVLSNIANDYGDSIHGADKVTSRKGPKRMVSDGKITKESMKKAIIIFSLLAFTTGMFLLWKAGIFADQIKLLVFLSLGVLAIAAAIFYTNGKRPYGYAGFGDISVFLFFGIVGVEGSYFLMCGKFGLDILLPAATCGFFSVGVLNINNIRDIESDEIAGKYSIPVRLGLDKARIYHLTLLSAGVICALWFTFLNFHSPKQFFFLIAFAPLFAHAKESFTLPIEKFDPLLKQLSLTTLFFCITFGLGLIF